MVSAASAQHILAQCASSLGEQKDLGGDVASSASRAVWEQGEILLTLETPRRASPRGCWRSSKVGHKEMRGWCRGSKAGHKESIPEGTRPGCGSSLPAPKSVPAWINPWK